MLRMGVAHRGRSRRVAATGESTRASSGRESVVAGGFPWAAIRTPYISCNVKSATRNGGPRPAPGRPKSRHKIVSGTRGRPVERTYQSPKTPHLSEGNAMRS
jgi:hypothetical protein